MSLTRLSDEALVSGLHAMCREGQLLLARLLLHLVEVEERRLHLKSACPTLFVFCTRRLGLSEGAAFRRVTAARLVHKFPRLLERLERGDIHLSTLVLLRDHLTDANVEELVDATSGKTKREVEELLARRSPRPDVPATIRKLPAAAAAAVTTAQALPTATGSAPAVADPRLPTLAPPAPPHPPAARPVPPPRIEPLSDARHKLQLTVSTEVRNKLERARDLMRHRNPSGDLAVVFERALDSLLAKLEKERLAKTSRPQRKRRPVAPGRVSSATRREVFERDGEQCTFVDENGQRCPARARLELDHVEARALGGSGDAVNIRVRCASHNLFHAEQTFGRRHVAERVHFRQGKSNRNAGVPP